MKYSEIKNPLLLISKTNSGIWLEVEGKEFCLTGAYGWIEFSDGHTEIDTKEYQIVDLSELVQKAIMK